MPLRGEGEAMRGSCDVLAVGAHPDDVEVFMGGTVAKLTAKGFSVLIADLSPGEPARHAPRGVRDEEARRAAQILKGDRITLGFQDRLIADSDSSLATAAWRRPGTASTSPSM